MALLQDEVTRLRQLEEATQAEPAADEKAGCKSCAKLKVLIGSELTCCDWCGGQNIVRTMQEQDQRREKTLQQRHAEAKKMMEVRIIRVLLGYETM